METTILRELRIQRKLKLRSLCHLTGYSDPILSAVETGKKTTWPKLQKALAKFYGVSPDQLFDKHSGIARHSQSSNGGNNETQQFTTRFQRSRRTIKATSADPAILPASSSEAEKDSVK